jgi:nucleotide-binding universal stress UspA family protein
VNVNVNQVVPESVAIHRILVALDGSAYSQAALETAANLAEVLKAELIGVFVEDINLLRLAQLPFAQEVRYLAARPQRVDAAMMAQQLHSQADRARQQLAKTADSHRIPWSFRVLQGTVTAELLAAALKADLLVLGRASRRRAQTAQLGSTARMIMASAPNSVLLVSLSIDLAQPMLVIYDGSAAAERALAIAASLAPSHGRLRVLIWTEDDIAAQEYKTRVVTQLHEYKLNLSFRRLHQAESASLVDISRRSGIGLLILAGAELRLPPTALQALLETCDLPVLVVR